MISYLLVEVKRLNNGYAISAVFIGCLLFLI